MKRIHWQPLATQDAREAADWYASQGGLALELAFIAELETAIDLIARHPASGSVRHARLFPELPAPLRFHALKRFNQFLIYYLELQDHIEIVRMWHVARGLDALLEETDNE